jgi:hypothetical protein
MTDPHRDFSCSTVSSIDLIDIPIKNIDFESSLESHFNFFDKTQDDCTSNSAISLKMVKSLSNKHRRVQIKDLF